MQLTPVLVAQLVAQFGLPFAQQIVTWVHEGKTEVSPEMWQTLVTLAQYRSSDALTAAGIKIVNGVVVPA